MHEARDGVVRTHPAALLKAARDLLVYWDPDTAGLWPRAAALLGRQALEATVDSFWKRRAPGVEGCSTRAKLLCLRFYTDEEVARRANNAWGALSRACHHHPYELAPTADELTGWMTDVDYVAQGLANKARLELTIPMTCREEVLEAIVALTRSSDSDVFTVQQVIDEINRRGTDYSEGTIRTHITSRMCRDSPDHHAVVYDDLERVGHGQYRLV